MMFIFIYVYCMLINIIYTSIPQSVIIKTNICNKKKYFPANQKLKMLVHSAERPILFRPLKL